MLHNATFSASKNAVKFYCDSCLFECRKNSEWNRHLVTTKHKNATKMLHDATCSDDLQANLPSGVKTPKKNAAAFYSCECGKTYKQHSSLYRHKKGCYISEGNIEVKSQVLEICKENQTDFKELVLLLLKENKDIQKNFIDLIPQIKGYSSNSHNTITNNTTNNNQFNISMFLNEHCKNAMNLTDFIDTLPITNETYNCTIENGLTKTITNMVVDGLNNMDVLERPIHCTDAKRKIMYIKDDNIWEKDTELNKLLHGIKGLALKQRTMINKWQDVNDGWDQDEDLQTKLTKLVFNSMTSIEDDEKETNKIIRAIGKNTYLNNEIKDQYK
jgi:hypothetical protein